MPEIRRNIKSDTQRAPMPTPMLQQAPGTDEMRRRMIEEPHHVDAGIVITAVLMLCFGLVMLFSASMAESIVESSSGTGYLVRQLLANLIGLLVVFLLTKFNIKMFDRPQIAAFFYFISLILLILTLFSPAYNGAKRWLSIPLFGRFQPSEFTKVVIVYTLACYESWLNKERAAGRFKRGNTFKEQLYDAWLDILCPVLIVAVPGLVIAIQPHVSGLMIILMVTFVCLIAAGLPARSWLISTGVVALVVAILVGLFVALGPIIPESWSKNYNHVVTRMKIFKQEEDTTDAQYYQSRQALIALGSGGLTGVGLGQGKQKNNYLPEGHNDYIFSNLVEETGFIGGMAVMILFLAFFVLGLRVAFRASSVYSQIVAAGISSLITIQALLNLAVNVGAIPPTGISLPFFSYGGTSNMFFLIGVGLLLNVSKYGVRPAEDFSKWEGK